jgi:hypothetical protein
MWIGALFLALAAGGAGPAADAGRCEPAEPCWLKRLHPVGGWDPYGGGLLHWWDPRCFPCGGGAPDDYCRKKLPDACRPPYPPYFQWGPPEVCPPKGKCPGGGCAPR